MKSLRILFAAAVAAAAAACAATPTAPLPEGGTRSLIVTPETLPDPDPENPERVGLVGSSGG